MIWGVYDDYTIRKTKPNGNRPILIRALEPSYLESGVPYSEEYLNSYVGVLDLYFYDINRADIKVDESSYMFTADKARDLIDFVMNSDFDEINIHCSAGISRSSALMICVSRILGLKEVEDGIISSKRYMPNKLVLSIFDSVFSGIQKDVGGDLVINSNEEFLKRSQTCGLIKNDDGTYSILF